MNIDQRIRQEYPYEIAETYRSYTNLSEDDYSSRILKVVELFEALLKTLCAANTKWFLVSNIADGNVQEHLDGFRSPSIGHWIGLFREVSRAINSAERASPPPLISAIVKFHHAKAEGGSQSRVFEACREVSTAYGLEPIKTLTNGVLIERFGSLRNKFQAHGALQALSKTESKAVACALHTMIHHLLEESDFLCSFELLYISEVKKKSGVFCYVAKTCRGCQIDNIDLFHPEDTDDPIEDGELYICSVDRESKSNPVIRWALSLSPYLVLASCKECKREQVFVFNGKRGKSLEYLSYQCAHFYEHAGLSDEFDNIKKLLSGEITRAKVFTGHLLGEKIAEERAVLTLRERLVAERKAIQANQLISEGSYDQAQELAEEALKEDRDSFLANHALALISIQGDQLKLARDYFQKAISLSPEHQSSLLGMALVCAELGDVESGEYHLYSLLRVDPTHVEARSLSQASLASAVKISTAASSSRKQAAIDDLVRRVQSSEYHNNLEIHSYLELLPPWSFIARSRIPNVISSFLIAALAYAILVLMHDDNEGAVFYLRFGVVCFIIFLGLWYPFVFASLLRSYYSRLERVALLPTDTFRRWYLAQVAQFFGEVNLTPVHSKRSSSYGDDFCVTNQLIAALSSKFPEEHASKITQLKDIYFRNTSALKRRLEEITETTISDKDLNFCIYRSTLGWVNRGARIRNRLKFWWIELRKEWRLLRWFIILGSIGSIFNIAAASYIYPISNPIIVFFAIFEVYAVVWVIFFFPGTIRLVPELIKQPVRYHIGLPQSLSLSVLTNFYLILTAFMTPINILFFFQHYIWRTHVGATIAMIGGLTMTVGALLLILCGPQVAVMRALSSLKQRKFREYAVSLERTFNNLLAEPTEEGFKDLQSKNEVMGYISKHLPSVGFNLGSCILFILLFVLNIGLFIAYILAIITDYWPWSAV